MIILPDASAEGVVEPPAAADGQARVVGLGAATLAVEQVGLESAAAADLECRVEGATSAKEAGSWEEIYVQYNI